VDFVGSSPLRTPALSMAITPDGSRLIYTGPDEDETSALHMRRLDDFTVEPLPGTGGACQPAISPDGRQVSFFAYDELRVTRLDGGKVRTIVAAPNPRGGAWWGNDRIICADQEGRNLWVVGVDGGGPRPLRLADDRLSDGRPVTINRDLMMPIPHGEGLLTTSWPAEGSSGRLVINEPGPGTLRTVLPLAVVAQAVDDALVYVIGNDLLAVEFDPEKAAVSGEPRKVGGELRRDGGIAQFVLSETTLIDATGAPFGQVQIAELTPEWELAESVIGPDAFGSLAVSPDGKKVAATVIANNLNSPDIWIYDLADGQRRRLTRGGTNHHPFWSADGETIYFSHDASDSAAGIYGVGADSAQLDKMLIFPTTQHLTALHPLGLATLPVVSPAEGDNESERDLSILDVETGEQTIEAQRPGVTEDLGALSPDARWLAFTSDASGATRSSSCWRRALGCRPRSRPRGARSRYGPPT
jgi:dipeptidyl aminopeptidase/acylaminoacyl peptidase